MNKALFYNGQQVIVDDFDYLQDSLDDYIKANIYRIYNAGVVLGISGYDTSPYVELGTNSNTIKVNKLIAYTSEGECIKIDSIQDNLKPDGTGLLGATGSWTADTTYNIVARYAYEDTTATTPSVHPITGVTYDTRREDSYTLYAVTTVLDTDVLLAQVVINSSALISVIYTDNVTQYLQLEGNRVIGTVGSVGLTDYVLDARATFQDHIGAVGTGTISKTNPHGTTASDLGINVLDITTHQQYIHSSGISTDDVNSTTSAFYITVVTETATNNDNVSIAPLLLANREVAIINGVAVTYADISSATDFVFIDVIGDPISTGYYLFYVDNSTKTIVRSSVFSSEALIETYVIDNPNYLPLWSIYWGPNPITGFPDNYNLFEDTLRDWRVFGNIVNKNVDSNLLGSLNTGTALGNRTCTLYNSKIVGTSDASFYSVSSKTFIVNVDGFGDKTVTFTGSDPIGVTEVISQMNSGITYSFLASLTDTNNIKLNAASSLVLGSGSANDCFGYSAGQSDDDDNLKEVVYEGDVPGTISLSYDGDNLSTVTAEFGEKQLVQTLSYFNNVLLSIEEQVI